MGICMKLKQISLPPLKEAYRWIFCKKRRAKNSERYLYAEDYGWKCWAFQVRDTR